jgi:hypothetical protein
MSPMATMTDADAARPSIITGHVDSDALRSLVERLSTLTRESGSDDERRAAELIAAELIAAGAERVRLEDERVHGTYWWPVGLPTAAAAVAGALGRRGLAVFAGALGAASVAGDIRFGPRPLRRLLPQRTTVNVVGEIGPADAPRTVVLISHHDAAHTGLIFSPTPVRVLTERFPAAIERTDTGPPLMWGAVGGPLLVALGALLRRPLLRRLGTLLSAGYAAAMADIGARRVVPGANDNATGCAALAGIARVLAGDPPPGTRVILLSTGSEESFSEGMVAFGRRHFRSLPTETTTFISFDTLGSPHLLALEGEGFLGIFEYPKDLLALVATTARELGIELKPGLRTRSGTDGVVPLRAGYPTVSLSSVDRFKQLPHYHLPTDTTEHVQWRQVADAVRLSEAVVRRLSAA